MIGYETVSETAKASVSCEGLISQRMLKVQSVFQGNLEEIGHRGGLAYSN
jgi:hypothetical protein